MGALHHVWSWLYLFVPILSLPLSNAMPDLLIARLQSESLLQKSETAVHIASPGLHQP